MCIYILITLVQKKKKKSLKIDLLLRVHVCVRQRWDCRHYNTHIITKERKRKKVAPHFVRSSVQIIDPAWMGENHVHPILAFNNN